MTLTRSALFIFVALLTMMDRVNAFGLVFKDNSQAMFEAVVATTPFFVRNKARNGLLRNLEKHGDGSVVTEELMYTVCKTYTPPNFLPKTIMLLDQHKTLSESSESD